MKFSSSKKLRIALVGSLVVVAVVATTIAITTLPSSRDASTNGVSGTGQDSAATGTTEQQGSMSNMGTDADTDADADTYAETSTDSSADTVADSSTDSSTDTYAETSTDSSTDTDAETSTDTDAETSTDRSTDTDAEASDESVPAQAVDCPCFDSDMLEKAVHDITGENAAMYDYQKDFSCTGGINTGIVYSQPTNGGFTEAHGYSVSEEWNDCTEGDAVMMTSPAQTASCKALVEEKCDEHATLLSGAAAAAAEAVECPCFGPDDLNILKDQVTSGSVTLRGNSCVTRNTFNDKSISYTEDEPGGFPVLIGYGTSSYMNEFECQRDDSITSPISENQKNKCAQIVDDACTSLGY